MNIVSTNTTQPRIDDRDRKVKTLSTNNLAVPEFDYKPRAFRGVHQRPTRPFKGMVTTANYEDLVKAQHVVPKSQAMASGRTAPKKAQNAAPAATPKKRAVRKPAKAKKK